MVFRIALTVRKRGEPIASSMEIKTEECLDEEELVENAINFIKGAMEALRDEEEEGADE